VEIDERWESFSDDYLKFERVENKRSKRPDLHVFLLIDELFPNPGRDVVCAAEHDVFYLDITGAQIEDLTDEQILELTRCGVHYDSETDSLAMFA
jgi:hypothetical protein